MDDHFKRRERGCGAQWQEGTSATSCRIPNDHIGRCDRNKTHLEPRLDLVLAVEPCAAQRRGLWSVQPDAAAPVFIATPFGRQTVQGGDVQKVGEWTGPELCPPGPLREKGPAELGPDRV